jgi:SPP1 family predicted phage head-tail adaptor
MLADKNTVTADCIFTIRYRAGVTEKMRVLWDGATYDIIHIAEAERRRYLALTAIKRV